MHEDGNLLKEDAGDDYKRAGVIVADNGQELLILTDVGVLTDASELQVRFADNTRYVATLKRKVQTLVDGDCRGGEKFDNRRDMVKN